MKSFKAQWSTVRWFRGCAWSIGLLASGAWFITSLGMTSLSGQDVPSTFVNAFATSAGNPAGVALENEGIDELESFEIRMAPLPQHDSAPVITALASSYDGRFLAAAGDDHAIRVIDVASGTTIRTLTGHTDWIQSLVFSSDAQHLYSAGNDGRVLRWNNQFPVSHTQVLAEGFAIRALTLSSEKNLLAVCGFSNEILLWDLSSGARKLRLSCDSEDQRCVRFSPDGSRLLRGGRLGEICVWDTGTGAELAHYRQHSRRVFTAAFSADGTTVTSVGEDRRLIRFQIESQQVIFDQEVARGKLMSMCLINDNMVAAAGADNSIVLVDVQSNQVVAQLNGHTGTVAVMVPCGEYLASGSFDTTIRIWNLPHIAERDAQAGRPVGVPLKIDTRLQIR
ncbi:MAG: WD40 repeat domain-containing protein [Planctomycetales bacterium]|nr:WD40 repeat domain-containing protein [Planctomycetales bacterium]MCA9180366.1 WD40 repeat domain-containing protein [Planctomycetales bacterium]